MDVELKEFISIMLPIISTIVILIGVVAFIIYSISKLKANSKIDKYRSAVENRIYRLEKELISNKDRFKQVNHLVLDYQANQKIDYNKSLVSNSQLEVFKDLGIDVKISVNKRLIFVLTPFNEKFDETYQVIKEAGYKTGFECRRGDEEKISNFVLKHILSEILKSRLVIANISGRNPNVMYELGICHAIGKPVVLLSESEYDIPYDISKSRVLIYQNNKELDMQLRKWIINTIENE